MNDTGQETTEGQVHTGEHPPAGGPAHAPPSLPLLLVMLLTFTRVNRYTRTSLLVLGDASRAATRFSSFDFDPSKLLVALTLGLLLCFALLDRRRKVITVDPAGVWLIAYGVLGLVSLTWALDPTWSLAPALRFFQYVVLYVVIVSLTRSWHDLNHWGHTFLYLAPVTMAAAVQEVVAPVRSLGTVAGEEHGWYLFIYPCYALLALPYALHYLVRGPSFRSRALSILALLSNLVVIFITQRRAAPLALGVLFISYAWFVGRRHRSFRVVLVTMVIFGALFAIGNASYLKRLSTIPYLGGADLSEWEGNPRLLLYQGGLAAFAEHPLLGLGAEGAAVYIRDVLGERSAAMEQHALVLSVATDFGVVGLIVYGMFVAAVLSALLRTIRRMRHAGCSLEADFAGAVLTSFLTVLFYSQFQAFQRSDPIYLCAALGTATYLILRGPTPLTLAQSADGSPTSGHGDPDPGDGGVAGGL